MKIGVKTFDSKEYLDHFKDKVDFFEIMGIRKNNYDFLKGFKNIEVIHAEHQGFGINIADKNKSKINQESIKFSINLADKTKAKRIIIHPGTLEEKGASKENSINFIEKLKDKRIIVENMPDKYELCDTPKETSDFLKKTKKGLCFDINHAIEAAISQKKDYLEYIKEFVKLNPKHYHIGGQSIKKKKTHLPLRECDFDLKEVIALLPSNAKITLETTTDIKNTEEDIKIIKKIIKELNK